MQLVLYLVVATMLLLAGRVRAETSKYGSRSNSVQDELDVTPLRKGLKNDCMPPIH
jgi:hypothetical protein